VELWVGLGAAAIAYLLLARGRGVPALRLAVAGALVWLLAGTLAGVVTGGYHAAFGAAGHPYCATLRTAVLSGIALALAWAGGRWKLVELSRLAIPAMLVGAYRLVGVDLAQDFKPALFCSLAVYGAVLVMLPRLTRGRREVPQTN